jgi:hypothetical protein
MKYADVARNVFAGSGLKYEATDVVSYPDTSVADFNLSVCRDGTIRPVTRSIAATHD